MNDQLEWMKNGELLLNYLILNTLLVLAKSKKASRFVKYFVKVFEVVLKFIE